MLFDATMVGNKHLFDQDASSSSSSLRDLSSLAEFDQLNLTPIKTTLQIYWDCPNSPSCANSPSTTRKAQGALPSIFWSPRRLQQAFIKPKFDVEEKEPLIP
jgi:hypothetical protein